MADVSAAPSERLHALDAVRGFALVAGIVFHASVSFIPSRVPVWIVMDHERSLTLAALFHVLHAFRMTTFFLIAGFFGRMMMERRGTAGFVRDRARRIAVPLVAGWPVLFALLAGVTIWGAVLTAQVNHTPLPPPPKAEPFPAFPLTHLWFLYLLLIFYALALALRAVAGPIARAFDPAVGVLVRNPLGVLVLAVPVAAALRFDPAWIPWLGIPTPDSSLVPDGAAFATYGLAFGLGWLVQRQAGLITAVERWWPLNLALFALAMAAGLALGGIAAPAALPQPDPARAVALAAASGLGAWSGTFAVVGLALRFLSGHSPARRYLADASYWLYLAHLPLIMALQVALSPLAWPWPVKFALILGVAFPILIGSYELFVRHSWLGALLNGRKVPRRRAKAETRLGSALPGDAVR